MKYIIIINLFSQTKNNLFGLILSQYSKIILKIRGIGDSAILGDMTNYDFQSINYLEEVYINGNKQEKIAYRYSFNQDVNIVELLWKDNLDNCENRFRGCINNFIYE